MDDKLMSPAASPLGVKPLPSKPLLLAYGVAALLAGVVAYVAYQKSEAQNQTVEAETLPRVQGESPSQIALRLMSARQTKPKEAPAAPPPSEPVVLVASLDEPPRPPRDGSAAADVSGTSEDHSDRAAEARSARRASLRHALSGSTVVPQHGSERTRAAGTPGSDTVAELERVRREKAALTGTDPTAAYQHAMQLAAAAQGQAMPGTAGTPPMQAAPTFASAGVGTYNRAGDSDRFRLDAELEQPRSRFVVQPGDVIPAVLQSAINSELPGPILAQVAVDVYDSPTHRHLLIPQGTKLFGEYASGVVFGQSRLLVAWQRLRFPNGQTLDIGEMPGTDGVGRSGFNDLVDNHYFRLFASALLLSGVTAGVAMSQDVGSGNSQRVTAGSAMSQALGQQLGQTAAQLIQKNMNVAPTLDIRPGYRFNVMITKDLTFRRPYRRQSP